MSNGSGIAHILRALRALWDADVSGWFVYDPDGRLAYANPAMERLTRTKPVAGSSAIVPDVVPESRAAFERTLRHVRSGGARELTRLTLPAIVGDRIEVLGLLLLSVPDNASANRSVVGLVTPLANGSENQSRDDVRLRVATLERALARIWCEVAAIAPTDAATLRAEGYTDLSYRQQEVLDLLAGGERAASIAAKLHVSVHTVRNHTKVVFRKLGVHSQAELMARTRPAQGHPIDSPQEASAL